MEIVTTELARFFEELKLVLCAWYISMRGTSSLVLETQDLLFSTKSAAKTTLFLIVKWETNDYFIILRFAFFFNFYIDLSCHDIDFTQIISHFLKALPLNNFSCSIKNISLTVHQVSLYL